MSFAEFTDGRHMMDSLHHAPAVTASAFGNALHAMTIKCPGDSAGSSSHLTSQHTAAAWPCSTLKVQSPYLAQE